MRLDTYKPVIQFSICLFLLWILSIQAPTTLAQEAENPWSVPYNLSKSGFSSKPSPIVDSTGVVHVIWLDSFDGYYYSAFVEGQWSQPRLIEFPFNERETMASSPIRLLNDDTGYIHAYWTGPRNTLYHSVVSETHIGSPGAWATPVEIARFVSGYDTAIDADGNTHLVYVRSQDEEGLPAGVYYRQSPDGYTWLRSQPIYLSPYFRSQEGNSHHVDISTTSVDDATRIFIGWDDPALNRVSIRRSNDGGETWDDPYDVARPGGAALAGNPFGILVWPKGDDTMVIWQTGVPEESCSTSYMTSEDGGESWGEAQFLLGNLLGCPTDSQFFESSDGAAILMTTIQDQVYLLAWNGVQWSESLVQSILGGFKDPATNALVTFQCPMAAIGGENMLYYAGCDPDGTGDVWITDRAIGLVADWFPPPPVWSKPSLLAGNAMKIFKPVSISDSSGRIHVLWTQEDQSESGERVTPIYYTRSGEEGWLTPVHILDSPDKSAEHLQIAIDSKDRLFLVWNGYRSGEIYFSWASAEQASTKSEWTDPLILPSLRTLNSSPSIVSTASGDLFVAYALTLNENRGIYLVSSSDGGVSWSSPMLVVDAVAAGLNMVDSPILSRTESGRLHLIFSQDSIPGDGKPVSIYYLFSDDDGATWSQPVQIVERTLDWFQMITPGGLNVQRFWQNVEQNVSSTWQNISTDDGVAWNRPVSVTSFGGIAGLVDVVFDPTGRLHLMQVVDDPPSRQILKHWIWDGEQWSAQEDMVLANTADIHTDFIDVVGAIDGRLGVSYVVEHSPVSEDQIPFELRYSERKIELPLLSPTSGANQSPTPQPSVVETTESVVTEAPIPQITSTPIAEQPGGGSRPLNLTVIGLGVGWFLVMAIVVGAFIFELRRRRKK